MASSITIEQLGEVGRQAQALGQAAKSAVSSALYKGAQVIAPAAKAKAPRSIGHRAGRGRNSKHLADAIVAAKSGSNTAGVTMEDGANGSHYYWKYLEHGTTKMRAQPFMAPAAEEKENEVLDAVANELKSKLGL